MAVHRRFGHDYIAQKDFGKADFPAFPDLFPLQNCGISPNLYDILLAAEQYSYFLLHR